VHPHTLAVDQSVLAKQRGMVRVSAESNTKVFLKGIYKAE